MAGILPDTSEGWMRVNAAVRASQRQEAAEAQRAIEHEALRAEIEDVLLGSLAEDVEAVLRQRLGHKLALARFRKYAAELGLPDLPASPALVAAYFVVKMDDSMKALELTGGAIRALHRLEGLPDPTDDLLPIAALRFIRRNKKGKRNARRTAE